MQFADYIINLSADCRSAIYSLHLQFICSLSLAHKKAKYIFCIWPLNKYNLSAATSAEQIIVAA